MEHPYTVNYSTNQQLLNSNDYKFKRIIECTRELFAAKADSSSAVDRKLSTSSAGSMKNKWLKAFRSLKPPSAPPPHPGPQDKRNGAARDAMRSGAESEAHNFQEYTYKKITPCDVCSQVLRGHTRQGLRCRICKMNVHTDCMPQVGKCQTKSRLLRRQKSTSEIESHRVQDTAFDEERAEDGRLPGHRLTKICFKGSVEFDDDFDSYYDEESEETTTRPFGQPLCFVKENGDPPPSILKPTASVRKKK
ncbi:SH3 and cysteine-rich domain-containing protein [Papilio machaon]|uniref:SH3 and cysteine-rich domain-containing protein n=1 Tax=Papilio machaon TaxID=76193 RepID=A0A194R2I0_PAPMA|nr:SH3 and cysteine-rich domain-containing protein [Papilio machaon]